MFQRNLPIYFSFCSCESCQFLLLKVNRIALYVFVIFSKFSQKKGLPGLYLLFSELFICQSEMTSFSWHLKLSIVSSYLTSIRLIIFQFAVFTSYMSVLEILEKVLVGALSIWLCYPGHSLHYNHLSLNAQNGWFSSVVVVFCIVSNH